MAASKRRLGSRVRRWVHPVVPRWGAGSIGRGFGKKLSRAVERGVGGGSRRVSRCWGALVSPMWWHLSVFVLCRGATYRSSSEKRLRFFKPAVVAYVRSPGSCAAHRRISRELRRNAATRSGNLEYRATTAQWHADRRAKRPKVAKLAANGELRQYVQDRLGGLIAAPDGAAVPGPNVRWVGRRRGRRQDRR